MSLVLVLLTWGTPAQAQVEPPAQVRAGTLDAGHIVDGRRDEGAWTTAGAIDAFTQADPREGEPASARTVVRVLAGPRAPSRERTAESE